MSRRPARLAAAALLALCGGAAWLDARSPTAALLRARRPVWGLAAVRYRGQPDVTPSAAYLLLLTPARRTLDAVLLPPGTGVAAGSPSRTLADVYAAARGGGDSPAAAGRAMAKAAAALAAATPAWPAERAVARFAASVTVGPASRPGDPDEVQAALERAARDPFAWARAAALWARSSGGPGAWDALALLRALRALPDGGVRLSRWPAPTLAPAFAAWLHTGAAAADPRGVVTVEVLNASGRAGVALRATKVLRLAGFDVVHFGNAEAPVERTAAVDRAGRPEAARGALDALGCRGAGVLTAFEPSPLTMEAVTLGRDAADCARLAGGGEED